MKVALWIIGAIIIVALTTLALFIKKVFLNMFSSGNTDNDKEELAEAEADDQEYSETDNKPKGENSA